jgi:hypothetical protein
MTELSGLVFSLSALIIKAEKPFTVGWLDGLERISVDEPGYPVAGQGFSLPLEIYVTERR